MKPISFWLNKVLQNDTQRPNSNYSAAKYQKFVHDLDLRKTDFLPRVDDLYGYLNQTPVSNLAAHTSLSVARWRQWLPNGLMFESGVDHRRILVGHDYDDEATVIQKLQAFKQQYDLTCVLINSKADWYNSHTLDENTTLVLVMSHQTLIAVQRQLEKYTDAYLVI